MLSPQICRFCRYWKNAIPYPTEDEVRALTLPGGLIPNECHAAPPTAGTGRRWPLTGPEDTCGAFRDGGEPDKPTAKELQAAIAVIAATVRS